MMRTGGHSLRDFVQDRNVFYSSAAIAPVEQQEVVIRGNDDTTFLQRCIVLIEANLESDDFNVQRLAKLIGVSHSVLYRKIKQLSGLAINPFVRMVRLRRAAELILKGEMNISECRMAVGIYDVKYFREQFVKAYGETPSEYSRRHKLEAVG